MILNYHNIFPDSRFSTQQHAGHALPLSVFKQHIKWLADHYRIVPLHEYLTGLQYPNLRESKAIAITFDDGLGITFESVFSALSEWEIPATFFVTTSHLNHGELLWFSYLNALCFEDLYKIVEVDQQTFPLETLSQRRQARHALGSMVKTSGTPALFSKTLSKRYPLPQPVVVKYEGMTHNQLMLAGASKLIEIGAHTMTHPYLDQLSKEMQAQEIFNSKDILSNLMGKPVRYIAYPGGEYNHDTIKLVKDAGYDAAFAVIPKHLGIDRQFEISRIGIHSPSLLKLKLKMIGVADAGRFFGLNVG